jgi:hypothetical protein
MKRIPKQAQKGTKGDAKVADTEFAPEDKYMRNEYIRISNGGFL